MTEARLTVAECVWCIRVSMADHYLSMAESTGLARQFLMNAHNTDDLDAWALVRVGRSLKRAKAISTQCPITFAAIAHVRKEIAHLTGRGFRVPYA